MDDWLHTSPSEKKDTAPYHDPIRSNWSSNWIPETRQQKPSGNASMTHEMEQQPESLLDIPVHHRGTQGSATDDSIGLTDTQTKVIKRIEREQEEQDADFHIGADKRSHRKRSSRGATSTKTTPSTTKKKRIDEATFKTLTTPSSDKASRGIPSLLFNRLQHRRDPPRYPQAPIQNAPFHSETGFETRSPSPITPQPFPDREEADSDDDDNGMDINAEALCDAVTSQNPPNSKHDAISEEEENINVRQHSRFSLHQRQLSLLDRELESNAPSPPEEEEEENDQQQRATTSRSTTVGVTLEHGGELDCLSVKSILGMDLATSKRIMPALTAVLTAKDAYEVKVKELEGLLREVRRGGS